MTGTPIVIIGAGGHATVVADALLAAGEHILGFTDPDRSRHGSMLCGLQVLGDDETLAGHAQAQTLLANGIGGTRGEPLRRDVQRRLEQAGWRFTAVRHPSAVVSPFSRIAPTAHLMAASVVQPGAWIGEGCIVNTGAIVEHDVVLEDFVHVAPAATVCGAARVGTTSHIGAGAVVRQGISLAAGTVVGAGAVVVKSTEAGGVLVGVPAHQRRSDK